jgi:hypothetical protein
MNGYPIVLIFVLLYLCVGCLHVLVFWNSITNPLYMLFAWPIIILVVFTYFVTFVAPTMIYKSIRGLINEIASLMDRLF